MAGQKKEKLHCVDRVLPGSIGEEMGVEPGDLLISVNDHEIEDIFDYQYLTEDTDVTLVIRKADGEEWELEIEKDPDEDLGLIFENGLMDEYRSCCNHCIFCFIDQMPKGLRETLYFKDDDSRLSFLQGNYVTLTNMKDRDIQRIIDYRLGPINISVHTTNPELRVKMLRNRFAGEALQKIQPLYDAGIEMNGQIVLCKGINDGEELAHSIEDLTKYLPHMKSVSVVPVGLTKYREGLFSLSPFTKEDAREVLRIIHSAQERCMKRWNTHFIHAGDEWYLLAEEPVPEADNYDGFPQLENGVGMMRLLSDEFMEALKEAPEDSRLTGKRTIACGKLIAPLLTELSGLFCEKYPGIQVEVIDIQNDFFGERITVSGLLTGQDVIRQLRDRELGDSLLLTRNMLRFGEEVFLDDLRVSDVEEALHTRVRIVDPDGFDLFEAMRENKKSPQ